MERHTYRDIGHVRPCMPMYPAKFLISRTFCLANDFSAAKSKYKISKNAMLSKQLDLCLNMCNV